MLETLDTYSNAWLGVSAITAGIWAGAGFVLGLIMVGRRPLGLFGDILLGLIGGVGAGWALNRFGGEMLDLGKYERQIAPSLSEVNAGYIGAFAESFIGALVLLLLIRLFIRR
jgi:uncharacterized membrane protein YeaQ/YmgE (transglycosylase-associated protein family)